MRKTAALTFQLLIKNFLLVSHWTIAIFSEPMSIVCRFGRICLVIVRTALERFRGVLFRPRIFQPKVKHFKPHFIGLSAFSPPLTVS